MGCNKESRLDNSLSFEELKVIVRECIDKCRAEETLLLNINQDLRSHLNVILSTIQLIKLNKKLDYDTDKYIDIIKRSSYKMLKLINNLIDANKLQNNCYTLEKKNVDIVQLIENTVEEIEKYAKGKGISLIFDTNKEECIAFVDPEAIDRVVMNLLSNAIKFSDKNTSIMITLVIEKDMLTISVKDQGIGVCEEEKDKIFNRFYQSSTTESKNYIGSGIGLDLTNYLVKSHDGKIELNSKIGEGSEFKVIIPLIVKEGLEQMEISDKNQLLELEFSDIYLS